MNNILKYIFIVSVFGVGCQYAADAQITKITGEFLEGFDFYADPSEVDATCSKPLFPGALLEGHKRNVASRLGIGLDEVGRVALDSLGAIIFQYIGRVEHRIDIADDASDSDDLPEFPDFPMILYPNGIYYESGSLVPSDRLPRAFALFCSRQDKISIMFRPRTRVISIGEIGDVGKDSLGNLFFRYIGKVERIIGIGGSIGILYPGGVYYGWGDPVGLSQLTGAFLLASDNQRKILIASNLDIYFHDIEMSGNNSFIYTGDEVTLWNGVVLKAGMRYELKESIFN